MTGRYCCAACSDTAYRLGMRRVILTGVGIFLALAAALMAAPSLINDKHPLAPRVSDNSSGIEPPPGSGERAVLTPRVSRGSEGPRVLDLIHHDSYAKPAGMSDNVYWALHQASAEWNVPVRDLARVSHCESTWNPSARSASGTYRGLFQHHRSYWPERVRNFNAYVARHNSREPNQLEGMAGDIYAAVDNARLSAWMVRTQTGWRPWSCRP